MRPRVLSHDRRALPPGGGRSRTDPTIVSPAVEELSFTADAKTLSSDDSVASAEEEIPAAVAPAAVSGATPPAGMVPAPAEHPKSEGHGPSRKEKHRQENRPPRPKPVPPPPRPHPADAQLAKLAYVIVNEAGASVYSASPVGREEFPDFDATLRGTISIGRRLQDPLAELVKIEPQSIGVGLYQHDVNPKQLKESLESVISSCVNFVGVDLNTASIPLLRHVSGLNQLTARRVVEFRKEKGPFTDREQLKEVEGIGPVTFTQAAGFLKIRDGEHPLDRTWVHPESYGVATQLLEKLGFSPEVVKEKDKLPELHAKLDEADFPALAKELEVGELTFRDIFDALARPDRDPREDLPKPIFKKGVLKLEDLQAGMELKGTVLNVVDFGAFVDIGLKDSGLVHISQLANRYIKSPHDVVSVGDVVTALGHGRRSRAQTGLADDGQARHRTSPRRRGGWRRRWRSSWRRTRSTRSGSRSGRSRRRAARRSSGGSSSAPRGRERGLEPDHPSGGRARRPAAKVHPHLSNTALPALRTVASADLAQAAAVPDAAVLDPDRGKALPAARDALTALRHRAPSSTNPPSPPFLRRRSRRTPSRGVFRSAALAS